MKIKIKRQIDELGRIVIPIDLRKQFSLIGGTSVYITVRDNGILIQPEGYFESDGND